MGNYMWAKDCSFDNSKILDIVTSDLEGCAESCETKLGCTNFVKFGKDSCVLQWGFMNQSDAKFRPGFKCGLMDNQVIPGKMFQFKRVPGLIITN